MGCKPQGLPVAKEGRSCLFPSLLTITSLGKIHSTFTASLNIQLGDNLIHIGPSSRPLSCFGAKIGEPKLRTILEHSKVGNPVSVKKGKLVFHCGSPFLLALDTECLPCMDLSLPSLSLETGKAGYGPVLELLSALPFQECTGIPWVEETHWYSEVLSGQRIGPYREVLYYFTGRGLGLTPSGDDILYGYTLAQKLTGKNQNWVWDWEANDWHRTTDVSRAYASALAKNTVSEDWLALVHHMATNEQKGIERALSQICDFGHTSGYDTLYGFYLGLSSVCR